MSAGKRYKFNGSRLRVQTGYAGSPDVITGVTAANPPVVSSVGSDLDDGSVVRIAGVVGMTELNGKVFVTDDGTADAFELAGVDASAYAAYVSGGTAELATFGEFCELTGANQQDAAADQVEVTTICSTAKEFEQGLSDSGTLQLDFNYAPNETVQTALRAAKISGDVIAVEITLPGLGGKVLMLGTVQQTSFNGAVNGVWTGSATIKLSGDMFVLPAA